MCTCGDRGYMGNLYILSVLYKPKISLKNVFFKKSYGKKYYRVVNPIFCAIYTLEKLPVLKLCFTRGQPAGKWSEETLSLKRISKRYRIRVCQKVFSKKILFEIQNGSTLSAKTNQNNTGLKKIETKHKINSMND